MSLPEVVSRERWAAARAALLEQEKELTRRRDALNVARRELPMVRVEEDYAFAGPDGEVRLADLFEGRNQLIVGHFMFDPSWEDGCPSCSAGADEVADGLLEHLHSRDTTLAYVSRAPYPKIAAYKERRGWRFPWYSSYGTRFNHDFGVTLDEAGEEPQEIPGTSVFLRVGGDVFHTYSSYARGAEWTGGSYAYLDLTPLGRQEDWEEPKGRAESVRAGVPRFDDEVA